MTTKEEIKQTDKKVLPKYYKPCQDHLGNHYDSFAAMCRAYDKSPEMVRYRLYKGVELEFALTQEIMHSTSQYRVKSEDHLGNKFDTFKDMCEYHNKSNQLVRKRLQTGMSLEDALTKPVLPRGANRKKHS